MKSVWINADRETDFKMFDIKIIVCVVVTSNYTYCFVSELDNADHWLVGAGFCLIGHVHRASHFIAIISFSISGIDICVGKTTNFYLAYVIWRYGDVTATKWMLNGQLSIVSFRITKNVIVSWKYCYIIIKHQFSIFYTKIGSPTDAYYT